MDISQLLYSAIQAALKAGREILSVYDSDFTIEKKQDESPVTLADKKAHEIITALLRPTQLPVLSEEGEIPEYEVRRKWSYFWMVDPLDGTKEFIKRNGEFTVNIALIHQQQPILGVIYVPVTNMLYYAAEGIGSYRLKISSTLKATLKNMLLQSTKLPASNLPQTYTIIASRSHLSEKTRDFIAALQTTHSEIEFISFGSSLKLCLLAEGNAHIYPRFAPTMEWDTAAGQAICELAGRKVMDDSTQKQLQYNKPDLHNNSFVAF